MVGGGGGGEGKLQLHLSTTQKLQGMMIHVHDVGAEDEEAHLVCTLANRQHLVPRASSRVGVEVDSQFCEEIL